MWVNCIEAGVVRGVADGGMSGPREWAHWARGAICGFVREPVQLF